MTITLNSTHSSQKTQTHIEESNGQTQIMSKYIYIYIFFDTPLNSRFHKMWEIMKSILAYGIRSF